MPAKQGQKSRTMKTWDTRRQQPTKSPAKNNAKMWQSWKQPVSIGRKSVGPKEHVFKNENRMPFML